MKTSKLYLDLESFKKLFNDKNFSYVRSPFDFIIFLVTYLIISYQVFQTIILHGFNYYSLIFAISSIIFGILSLRPEGIVEFRFIRNIFVISLTLINPIIICYLLVKYYDLVRNK